MGARLRLDDPNTVDYLVIEKGTGNVVVVLLDDYEGADHLHRYYLVQEKLKRYLDFIGSGEVFGEVKTRFGFEVPTTTPVMIRVYAMQDAVGEGAQFLEYAKNLAASEGVGFEFRVEQAPNNG